MGETASMRELIEYVAGFLVDHPGQVEVRETSSGSTVIYELKVAPEDVGKVIGKQGRVAHALRTVLKAASLRAGKRATLEIL